ncbi:hypothetical protein D3C87_1206620 [compost metagenome]
MEQRGDLAAQQVGQRRGRTLVRNVRHRHLGHQAQQLSGHVRGAANARRAVGQPLALLPGIGQEFGEIAGRHAVVDHQHVGRGGQQRDVREILRRVVRQLGPDGRVDHVVRGRDQQRVAVRVGARHDLGADLPAGAGAVVHHEGLLQLGLHVTGDAARQQVGHAARRERHDDGDGLGGPVLLREGRRGDRGGDRGGHRGGREAETQRR